MSLNDIIHGHHHDEMNAVVDAEETQKLRVSIERRIHNLEKLVLENVDDTPRKHKALAAVREARILLENMLDQMDIPF